jgi:hypothetical protein
MLKKKVIHVFLFLVLPTPGLFSQGTCNCGIPIDSSFHIVPMTQGSAPKDQGTAPLYQNDDGSTLPIKLPFTFCYYGQSFNTVFINNNGNISFVKPVFNFSTHGFPLGTDTLMIAPFYADVNTIPAGLPTPNGGNLVYYKITPTNMTVKWNAVEYQTTSGDIDVGNTFQLIITNGFDPILPGGNTISFCYQDMGWATSDVSGGLSGFSGTPATVGVNMGNKINYAQFGRFSIPGATYYGPFASYNGLWWLNNKSFIFNTCVTGNTIPPVIVNAKQTCDTLTVCAGKTLTVTVSFLSPQQGQTSTISVSSTDLTGLSLINTSTSYNIASATAQLIPSVSDTGVHVFNITATDNSSPALTSTIPFIVIVNACGGTGMKETTLNNNFSIYPDPNSGNFTIQVDNQQSLASGEVKIYDLLGNGIYSTKLKNIKTEIDLSSKPKGIFFLKLYIENTPTGMKKIVIE